MVLENERFENFSFCINCTSAQKHEKCVAFKKPDPEQKVCRYDVTLLCSQHTLYLLVLLYFQLETTNH